MPTKLKSMRNWFKAENLQYRFERCTFADNLIVKAKCCKCLGVIIDETFSWGPHVEYVRTTVSSKLGMLTRIRDYVTQSSLQA